ncbi:MAG: MotA/TolQ/ExbB proton channel family protein [Planctomycetota bacterium]
MISTRRFLMILLIGAALGMTASLAFAQDGTTDGAQAGGESFASAFLFSRRTNPDGEKSLEIIGSLVIWFLICLNMVSLGLIGQMSWLNQRRSILPPTLIDAVDDLIREGKYRDVMQLAAQDKSFYGRVMHDTLEEASHGFGAMMRRLEQTADELTTIRFRRLEFLNVLGQVSPMIGLFGTVYGMILAFQAIVISGGNANPVLLAGGIGTALTTTFWGLVVAIPALAAYAILRNRVDELTTEAAITIERQLGRFRPTVNTPGARPTAQPTPQPSAHPEAARG